MNKSLTINMRISHKDGKPSLELRKVTTDNDIIKGIISAAFHEKPIIIYPMFTNKIKSIGTLLEKGIIYKDIDDKYYFTL